MVEMPINRFLADCNSPAATLTIISLRLLPNFALMPMPTALLLANYVTR